MPEIPVEQSDRGSTRRWLIAVAASVALNGAMVCAPIVIEKARSQRVVAAAVMAIKTEITKLFTLLNTSISDMKLKSETKQEWQKLLEADPSLPNFDYGSFFVKVPWLEGYITMEELGADLRKLGTIIENYSSSAKIKPPIKVIGDIIAEQWGDGDEASGNLHELLTENKGNCHARAQKLISIIGKVFPSIPLKIQISRQQTEDGTDSMHETVLAEIDDVWYSLEPGMPKSSMEDLQGTAIFYPSDYVRKYLATSNSTVKPDMVKADKELNNAPLTPVISNSVINLQVDPDKLSTKQQKTAAVSSTPVEFTVVTEEQVKSSQKEIPNDQEQLKKRPLTEQEIVKAALTKRIKVTPDIESFEPLRGIPLDFLYLVSPDDQKLMTWASFEPFAETPPKGIAISIKLYTRDSEEEENSGNGRIPDLSPLYGKTEITHLNITTNGLEGWAEILGNFEIEKSNIGMIFDKGQRTLKPLAGAKITTSLELRIATRGILDLTGIDSMAVTPPQLNMDFFAKQKPTNLHLLERVRFTEFTTSDYMLDSGVLDGATIHTDIVKFITAPQSRDPKKVGHLKDVFRTRRVIIIDEETEYSDAVLEPLRGMPSLDYLEVEMESHLRAEYLAQYGHVSYAEQGTGKKPILDLSPIKDVPVASGGLKICDGYDLTLFP